MGKDFDFEKLRGSDNYHTWQFAVISYSTYHELDHTLKDRVEIVHEGESAATTPQLAALVPQNNKAKKDFDQEINQSQSHTATKC